MNLKFGEYWKISPKDLLKFYQKMLLENSIKSVVLKNFFIAKTYNTKCIWQV